MTYLAFVFLWARVVAKVVTLPNEIPDPEMKEAKAKSESVSSENILPPRISACSE